MAGKRNSGVGDLPFTRIQYQYLIYFVIHSRKVFCIYFYKNCREVPYILTYKSRNFGQNLNNFFTIRLIQGSEKKLFSNLFFTQFLKSLFPTPKISSLSCHLFYLYNSITGVVCFNLRMGALHAVCWSKYFFDASVHSTAVMATTAG